MSKLNISDEERAHILEMHHNQVRKDVYERSGFNEQNNSYITNPDDQEYIRRDTEYKKAHPEPQKGMTNTWPPQDPGKSSPFPIPKDNSAKGPGPGNQPGMTNTWPPQDPSTPSSPFPLPGVPKNQGPPPPNKPVTPVPPVTSKQNMPGAGSGMVKQIQDKLNGLGIKVVSDGKLGPATLQAVLSALSRLGSGGQVDQIASKPVGKVTTERPSGGALFPRS